MGINTQIVSNFVAPVMSEFFAQMSPIQMTANRQYQKSATMSSYATGGTFNIKIPGYFTVTTGLTASAEAITDLVTPYTITVNDFYSTNMALDLFEEIFNTVGGKSALTTDSKDAIVDNYARPAFLSLMGQMEIVAAYRLKVNSFLSPIDGREKLGAVNTASVINDFATMADYMKFSVDQRTLMMNGFDYGAVANSLNNSFASGGDLAQSILDTGRFASKTLSDFKVFKSVDMPKHVAGPLADVAGITVSSIDETGTLLTLTGVTSTSSQLINAGDKISIPSVYLVQPITKQVLPYRLVVTAAQNANGNGSGQVIVTLPFPLMASGQHANVAALPANGAPVTVFPSYNNNFGYVKSGLSTIMLPTPDIAGAINSVSKTDFGCPVKVYVQGLVSNLQNAFRIQTLQACKVIPPYVLSLPSLA